jgi:hypothetical protein
MKPSIYRRIRRRSTHDVTQAVKERGPEQSFFGITPQNAFFQPAPIVQRKCEKCKEEEKLQRLPEKKEDEKLQKKETGHTAGVSPGINNYVHSLNGSGYSLSAEANQFFSEKMGYNFSNVRIHTGKEAAASAREVNAKAYTVGEHVVFNDGQYNMESADGKKLLAHELAHVMQQDRQRLQRDYDEAPEEMIAELPGISVLGKGSSQSNKVAYGNCAGVSVQGITVANYDHGNFSASSSSVKRAPSCNGCSGDDCITVIGTVVSTFQANPVVTLPAVPGGLNPCEQNAVRTFINTTLSQHEQQHVTAFNTYNGRVSTPFNYTGCRDGLEAHVQNIHDGINTIREASSNALSDALDPFNVSIPCNCPDPEPDAGKK